MASRVTQTVIVPNPLGQPLVLRPGDKVPAWAASLITNPAVLADDSAGTAGPGETPDQAENTTPEGDPEGGDADGTDAEGGDADGTDTEGGESEGTDADGTDEDEDDEPTGPPAPPRSGKGSGKDAWIEYAERIGVEVPEGADRDAIIAAVDDALND